MIKLYGTELLHVTPYIWVRHVLWRDKYFRLRSMLKAGRAYRDHLSRLGTWERWGMNLTREIHMNA